MWKDPTIMASITRLTFGPLRRSARLSRCTALSLIKSSFACLMWSTVTV
ncbi:MAG: hypothetical protein PHD82_12570 [Candidatus Riflebacteria bacterium]|nr:hypothetical protein [Candidatus Riflebacteria bacterium]